MYCFCCLVDHVAFMLLSKHIFAYESVQINVHKFEEYVNISLIRRTNDLLELYYMWMLKFLKKHDLSVCSLSICGILKSIKVFFKSIEFSTSPLLYLPNDTVGSTAYFLDDFETFADVGLNFLVLAHNNSNEYS